MKSMSMIQRLAGWQGLFLIAALTAFSAITPYAPPSESSFSTATSKVIATNSPSSITIDFSQWAKKANYDSQTEISVYRKLAGARADETNSVGRTARGSFTGVRFIMQTGNAAWGTPIATFSVADFKAAGYTYTDATVQSGVHYEYRLSPGPDLNAGIRLPLEENRGKLLLVIDDTMQSPLAGEIAQLQADLRGDGWTVITEYVARMAVEPATAGAAVGPARRAEIDGVRNLIRGHYQADPANVKAVYLLGRIPQPHLGNTAYDGHGNHQGAWAADIYYAEMDDAYVAVDASNPSNIGQSFPVWSDEFINNTTPLDLRNDNIPGDGKLDQPASYDVGMINFTAPPSADLAVSRVDFSGLTWFPESETELLRRYLRKAHDYRMRQGLYATIRREMFWDNSWGVAGYERLGNRWASGTVGLPNMYEGDWFRDNSTGDPWLLGNAGGAGGFTSAGHVGDSRDFASIPSKSIFLTLFGSYFGDWGANNNLLRSALAGTPESTELSCDWNVFSQQYTGLGKPLAYGVLQTLQENTSASGYPINALHGDLALRTTIIPPVRNLRLTPGNGTVTLAWDALTGLTAESVLQGYHVYRATSPEGPFTRITGTAADGGNPAGSPIAANTFTDTALSNGTAYTYMVKAIALTTENAGSYMNSSIGVPMTVTPSSGAVPPAAPGVLTAEAPTAANVVLSWSDNSTVETGFVIERRIGYDGSWTAAGSVGANATGFVDAGPLSPNQVTYYRVKATGTVDSSWVETSVQPLAGEITLSAGSQVIEIAGGTVAIPVERRFGSAGAVSVTITTASPTHATAQPGVHYTATSQTLSWADGESGVKILNVPVLPTEPWLSRAFQVNVSNPAGGVRLGVISQGYVAMENPATGLPAPWKYRLYAHGSLLTAPNNLMGAKASQAEGAIGMAHSGLPADTTSTADGFVYRQMTGDGVVSGRLKESRSSSSNARSGLMVRPGQGSYRFSSGLKGTGLETLYWDTSTGKLISFLSGGTATAPHWFRIVRSGDTFTAETSSDGNVWSLLSTQTLAGSPATQLWGFNDAPGNAFSDSFSMAAFDNLSLLKADRPTGLTAEATGPGQVTLAWTDRSDVETGYRIETRPVGGVWTLLGDAPQNAVSHVVNGMDLSVSREFRVAPIYDGFAMHDGYDPVYVQNFPARAVSSLGWAMIYKNGATLTDEAPNRVPVSWSVTDSDGHPGVNPRVDLRDAVGVLTSWPTGGSGRALFLFTEDQPLPAAEYPREKLLISVDRKDTNSEASPMRFALKIGGQWYASAVFTIAAASDEYTRHQIDFRTNDPAVWSQLNYVSGSALALGPAATLPSGDIQAFGIYFDDGFNNAGVHLDTFRVGMWNPLTCADQIVLQASQDPDDLSVTPSSEADFSGEQGGACTPAAVVYTLSNAGDSSLSWSATKSQSWLNVVPVSGTLAAGSSVTVTASVNAVAADALPSSGLYTDTLVFSNSTSGVAQNRGVSLDYSIPQQPSDPYADWASDYGLASDSMLDESPAGDGIVNLMKYALGISPTNAGWQGHLEQGAVDAAGTNYFMLRYKRPEPAPADLTYNVQAVESLLSSNWVDGVEVSSTVSNDLRTVTVRDPLPMSGNTNRFLRLKVTK